MQALLDGVPTLIARFDRGGRLTFMNRAVAETFEIEAEAALGRPVRELIGEESWKIVAPAVERVLAGESPEYTRTHRRSDGSLRHLVFRFIPERDAAGAVAGWVSLGRDVTGELRALEAREESEARYRRLVQVLPDAVIVHRKGHIVFANEAAAQLLGADSTMGLLGRPILAHVHPDSRALAAESLRAFDEGAKVRPAAEQTWLRLDGAPVAVELISVRFRHEGRRAVLSLARDITDRKAAEARLRSAIEAFREPISVTDAEDRIVIVNRAFRELNPGIPGHSVGRTYEEHLRAGIALGYYPDAAGREQGWIAERLARRRLPVEPFEVRRQDGRWLLVADQRLPGGGVITISVDITARKAAETALRETQRRLQLALDASGASIWDTDLRTREVYLSEGWAKKLGAEAGPTRTTLEALMAITHPEDLPRVIAASLAVMKGESAEYEEEHRVRARSGDWIWVRSHGRVVERDAAGRALRMMGTNFDITEHKREESLLRLEHAVTRCLADAASAPAGLVAAIRTICESEGWEAGRYFAADERAGLLRFVESWTPADARYDAFNAASRHLTFAPGVGIAGRVWQSGEAIWVPDVTGDARVVNTALAKQSDIRSALVLPVTAEGRTIGVLATFSRRVRAPEPRLLEAMRVIGAQLGQFLRRKEAEERLAYLAQFDPLTRLPNRALFRDRLEQALAQAQRNRRRIALMVLDMDNFKNVNDTLGHGAGDDLLRVVAARLHACLRSGDTVARLSGDEFAVVLPDLDSAESAGTVAKKLLESLKGPIVFAGSEIFAGASIGIAVHPADGADAEALLRNADIAMYRAKAGGRNRYQFFTPEMNSEIERRLALERDLRHALARGEFELHYQPKREVSGARITGAEALLRWRRKGETLVSPAEFIPVLEDTGLIVEVGDWVLREACRQHIAWREAGLGELCVAVNVSARQFRDGRLLRSVERALADTGCPAQCLELEITESTVMHDVEVTVQALDALRTMGVRIAVDDFGTGYSSLAYLRRLPIDVIKIDRSFVRELPDNAGDAVIVGAILAMARSLGFRAIAEGVETESQRRFLQAEGCDEMQGYLVSRPLPAAEFARWAQGRKIANCRERLPA